MNKHTSGTWTARRVDNQEWENAMLISTAPEMLDMLKECRATLASVFVYGVPEGMVDRVNALIQKAEGNDALTE